MKCLNCNNSITIIRNILNLFSLKKEYICASCYKKSNFNPGVIQLPISEYKLSVCYILEETIDFKYDSLVNEYSKIYNCIDKNKNFVITYNRFYMIDSNYIFLEQLARHHKKDIFVLVFEMKD